jgi:hypothetical protein
MVISSFFLLVPNVARRSVGISHGLALGQIANLLHGSPTVPLRCDVPRTRLDMTMRFTNKKPARRRVCVAKYVDWCAVYAAQSIAVSR